jgi:hypothetical protein
MLDPIGAARADSVAQEAAGGVAVVVDAALFEARSCIWIWSPSMPVISLTRVTRRLPPTRRDACTIRLIADATC